MTESIDNSTKISEAQFMRLFLKHEPSLRAFSRSLLPDWNLVEDALQDACITMLEKLSQLRDEAGFLPWAMVILRFKCLKVVEKLRRDRIILSDHILVLIADEAESIESEEYKAIKDALTSCLPNFSDAHQELLLAPYAGDGRVKQIAEDCNKSVNALYKLLGRLRDKLAVCIRKQLGPEVS
ncbi:MAG: RNA polymerase factor sigma-70 [Blastopirellula sp.]|nr:MAG: RNA polymerase factor sigma-70 [Blastopirellula sp.]